MGRNKAELTIDGCTVLERTAHVLRSVVEDVLIVGYRGAAPAGLHAVPDDIPDAGPLGGLATGLRHARGSYAVAVACDLPLLDREVLLYLLRLAPGYDTVVPRIDGRSQPLHAVYGRHVHESIERQLRRGDYKVELLLDSLRVRWVEAGEIEGIDPDHRSFVNVNTPRDWARARGLAAGAG